MEIITRKEAQKLGLSRYFPNSTCKYGHVSERNTANGCCISCIRLREQTPARKKKKNVWYSKNVQHCQRKNKINYSKNKIKYSKTNAAWKKKNKNQVNFNNSKRRAIKKCALPKWAILDKIKSFYLNCPKDLTVDHIIPLINPLVCGLHVIENLQYLTKHDNYSKNNSFKPYRAHKDCPYEHQHQETDFETCPTEKV